MAVYSADVRNVKHTDVENVDKLVGQVAVSDYYDASAANKNVVCALAGNENLCKLSVARASWKPGDVLIKLMNTDSICSSPPPRIQTNMT